jgi:signal transduction histidine kinase
MDQIVISPEQVDVGASISRIISEFGWNASIELPGSNCEIYADPVRFGQIVRNLIANAHRYGGSRRRIVCDDQDSHVSIEVRDDGLELPEAERERIFEPYARAHSRPGVTASVGLGLAVSRRLARLMGGELTYEYDLTAGEGIFRLTLPGVLADSRGGPSD